MSGECEEVDKWLCSQILINLFEVHSPQAMNLLKSGELKQGNCQTNDHACHGQKKKKNWGFDTQQWRSSRVRHWSKNDALFPPNQHVCRVWVLVVRKGNFLTRNYHVIILSMYNYISKIHCHRQFPKTCNQQNTLHSVLVYRKLTV